MPANPTDPRPVRNALELAERLIKTARFPEGEYLLKELIQRGLALPRLYRLYAELLLLKGDLRSAVRNAERAVLAVPADHRSRLFLGQLYLKTGGVRAARRLAGALLKTGNKTVRRGAIELLSGRVKRFDLAADISALLELFRKAFLKSDYRAAFGLAETLLNARAPWDNEVIHGLTWPITERSELYKLDGLNRRIRALYQARLPDGMSHFKYFYLAYLGSVPVADDDGDSRGLYRKAESEWSRITAPDIDRYGWMLKELGRKYLYCPRPDHLKAKSALLAAMRSSPAWDTLCRLAEVDLCLGRVKSAFSAFDRALSLFPDEAGGILSWRGQARLFTGDYRGAMADLDAAADKNAPYAFTWRAIARMKTGDLSGAFKDINRAVALNPVDGEARVVKVEVLRLRRELKPARKELSYISSHRFSYQNSLWAALNGILLSLDSGDVRKAEQLFNGLDSKVSAAAAKMAGIKTISAAPGARVIRRAVNALFESAKGCRRDEEYLFPVWLPRAVSRRMEKL